MYLKVKKIAHERGIMMNYLIRKCGYSRKTFYSYLNGYVKRQVPADFKKKVADALRVPVSAIDS